jgi:hypothetical protein
VSELDDQQRARLDDYARATRPSPADIDRALTRTLARIETSKPRGQLPSGRRRVWMVAAASVAVLVLAGAAMAGVRWLRAQSVPQEIGHDAARYDRHGDTSMLPAPTEDRGGHTAIAVEPDPPEQPEQPPTLEAPSEPVDLAPASDEPSPEPKAPERTRARHDSDSADHQPEKQAAPTPTAAELADESRLLGRIRKALDLGDFESALDWAEEHTRRHPDGALSEERLILETVAACRDGQRARGRSSLSALRERFPGTPAIAKVERACAELDP